MSLEQLRELAERFRGRINQMPPPFSAKKIHGVPAYKLARKHKPVQLQPVQVEVKEFEILGLVNNGIKENGALGSGRADNSQPGDRASFRARVASGTYLRSVAHDMGQQLGCGAHLESLRRTSLGELEASDAHSLEEVDAAARKDKVEDLFVHPRKLLPHLPAVTANEESAARIRNGRAVNLPELSRARQVKVFQGQSELIAIVTRVAGTLFHPKIVLVGDSSKQTGTGFARARGLS